MLASTQGCVLRGMSTWMAELQLLKLCHSKLFTPYTHMQSAQQHFRVLPPTHTLHAPRQGSRSRLWLARAGKTSGRHLAISNIPGRPPSSDTAVPVAGIAPITAAPKTYRQTYWERNPPAAVCRIIAPTTAQKEKLRYRCSKCQCPAVQSSTAQGLTHGRWHDKPIAQCMLRSPTVVLRGSLLPCFSDHI